jgi:hypothetical protein
MTMVVRVCIKRDPATYLILRCVSFSKANAPQNCEVHNA